MLHPKFEIKIERIRKIFFKNLLLQRIFPLITGILAFIWFLVRVIPKPQRATYPCMKVAYPLMSGFVIWFLGITGLSVSLKIFLKTLRAKKYILAFGAIILFFVVYTINSVLQSKSLLAAPESGNMPVHIANAPFGIPQGIVPGRVVWAWNPDATNENCTNVLQNNDGYFLEKNNNQQVIDEMFANCITGVGDKKSQKKAWDAIFKHFNKQKGKGENGYKKTETIFIKINQGHASIVKPDLTRRPDDIGTAETSPAIVLALLNQLVDVAGVPQDKIIVADPMSHIYQYNYELFHSKFPNVKYGDKNKEAIVYGRTLISPDTVPVIFYSDKGTVITRASDECLYKEMEKADYLINIAALKAHGCAGITLCAKNNFGSITRKNAVHLHTALVSRGNDRPTRVDYGMYRVFVDLMGSKYLGRNTMLFIVDGLWGGTEAIEVPVKWQMEPFNNDWPNSIFMSMDPVAIESVCFDFLRNEAIVGVPEWKNRPNFAQGVDDYLHQAASSEYWPEGITYDPDNSGIPMPSLGVHEHWNNPVDKQYYGNMGKTGGIELVQVSSKKTDR